MKLLGSADLRADQRGYGCRWLIRVLVAGSLMVSAALPLGTLGTAPARADGAGTTVEGPPIWIPNPAYGQPVLSDGTDFTTGTHGDPGTVTVDQTENLTNQVIHVSWTGFTPTVTESNEPVPVLNDSAKANAKYAVRVYQCRGTRPRITDCYGSTLYGGDPAKGFDQLAPAAGNAPEFLSNNALATTRPDGTGDAYIEIWTSKESQTLGCDATHPCSIVVEPEYGGNALGISATTGGSIPPNCDDHSLDNNLNWSPNSATDNGITQVQDQNGNISGERCAWSNHVVVPLSFSPSPSECKASKASFSAEGLPMFARAAQQWIVGACLSKSPLTVQYSAGLTEPQARTDFLQGINSDVAFTALPADPGLSHAHPYVYAPLANSSIAVVFVVDDPNTGQQILHMNLNARLMAKLLTQSYVQKEGGSPIKSVAGNANCLFVDPEFLQLNPPDADGTTFPGCNAQSISPIVTAGNTDLVHQLTSWIAADPDARAFLQGTPDPWGMHIDTYYLPSVFSGYPVDSFVPQDFSGFTVQEGDPAQIQADAHYKSFEWNPLGAGLAQVARNLLLNTPTCLSYVVVLGGGNPKCGPLPIGGRTLIGILDAGQAAAYRMPVAAIQNPAGQFVQPTLNSMSAAVGDMVTDKATGTQSLPYGTAGTDFSKDQKAYPLTTVQYAMLPTGGINLVKAGKIADFIRTITSNAGQTYGIQPGELAPGFLALTPTQQAQAAAAAQHVAGQDDTPAPLNPPGGHANGPGTGHGITGIKKVPLPKITPAAGFKTAPTPKVKSLGPLAVTGVAHPDQADAGRLVLPIALIAGLALLLAGPLGALMLGTSAGADLMNRVRRAASGRR